MADVSDMDLMREYADRFSEPAFAELVRRHIDLVYSVARRYVGNSQDAQDVTQAVFIILAKKVANLRHRTTITGWLYETTRFTASQLLRTRARQQAREQEAYMRSTLNDPETDNLWRQLAPILEEGMTRLNEKERALLALRFFENKSSTESAALLGLNEWAARKRADRAVEKLRKFFVKRGVSATAAVIAGVITTNSSEAAPAMLAKTVTAVAITKDAAASASTLTLTKGALKLMAWTKMKTTIAVGVGVLLMTGTTAVTVRAIESRAHNSWQSLFHFFSASGLDADLNNTPPQVTILPTIHPDWGAMWWSDKTGRKLGINSSVKDLLCYAYGGRASRMVFSEPAPAGKFDFIVNLPQGSEEAFKQKIKEQFGLVAHKGTVETEVWVLKVSDPEKLKAALNKNGRPTRETGGGTWKMDDAQMSRLTDALEGLMLFAPVIDRTGASGKYDFALHWDYHNKSTRTAMITDELSLIGIELAPARELMEMLIVEKAP